MHKELPKNSDQHFLGYLNKENNEINFQQIKINCIEFHSSEY